MGRDRQAWAQEKSAKFQQEHADELQQSRLHFVESRLARLGNSNSQAVEQLRKVRDRQLSVTKKSGQTPSKPPVPGGLGWGVSYNNNALLWSGSTCIYLDYVAPKTPGGDVTTWLYNTATNRSNKGVEAYISYYAQQDFVFKVFDWARTATNPWVLDIPYQDLAPYLVSEINPDGVPRQELKVVNCTQSAGGHWTNIVWLLNFQTGNYDAVYSYDYTTANAAENTFQTGDGEGWWGPIFETFQDHNGTNKAIGTGASTLLQDGNWRQLSSTNSTISIGDADLNPPLFQQQNAAWAVGSKVGEFSSPVKQANEIFWASGSVSGSDVVATANNPSNWLLWAFEDKFGKTPRAGRYVAQFDISTSTQGTGEILWAAIYDVGGNVIGSKTIKLSDFHHLNTTQPFRIEFNTTASSKISVGLYFNGGVGAVRVDKVMLSEI